ncbi:M28 family metallopeptidase [Croceitalea marina]|uniref:M28 family metallopeptidase n=1 Tax=Croceitalea marina TaxID=1775166 RepID=A0ABW5MX73_9FLAO
MFRQIFFISFFWVFLVCNAQENNSIVSYQKKIISKLTGKEVIDAGIYLHQRATYKERFITANYLAKELRNLGWFSELQNYRKSQSNYFLDLFFRPNRGNNVVGKLLATVTTKEYIILGAHYDSERNSPGAVDNASGVALCLALAKELKQLEHRNYNVLIVFFDQEEDDEVGSTTYVESIQKKILDVNSVHIFDLIGYDSDGDFALTLQSPTPFLEEIYRSEAEVRKIPIQIINGAGSDNKPFMEAGYPTVHPFEELDDRTPYYHSSKDTYETINFGFLANTTQYIKSIITKILENDEDV